MEPDVQRPEATEITTFAPPSSAAAAVRRPDEPPDPPIRSGRRLTLILLAATCVSTFVVGFSPGAGPVGFLEFFAQLATRGWSPPLTQMLVNGALYATSLMLILFCHEMGHYIQSRRYGVPATLPFFIPFPLSPFGTFGAVIVQGRESLHRRALFDIAISGPLAGLVIAMPVAMLGAKFATVVEVPPGAMVYTDPPILRWMLQYFHGPIPPGFEAQFGNNPLLFAGWVGFFITALNLIPIGQLDGGHMLYALIGRKAHAVAILLLVAAVAFMIYARYPAFGLMVLLLILMGPRHPPTADDTVPLGRLRILLGWLTLAFIFVGFTPRPIVQM